VGFQPAFALSQLAVGTAARSRLGGGGAEAGSEAGGGKTLDPIPQIPDPTRVITTDTGTPA
jgi:hypothetical protein